MTSIGLWCLKQILHGQLKQGTNHTENLAGIYMLIRDEIENTFREDNIPTLNAYCKEIVEGVKGTLNREVFENKVFTELKNIINTLEIDNINSKLILQ